MKILAVALLVAPFAAGCSSKAKTPKEAAVKFVESLWEQDKDQFMAVVHVGDPEIKEALYEATSAMVQFAKEFQAEYGEEAGVNAPAMDPKEVADKIKIEEKDGKKVAILKNKPMPLVQKEDAWMVDMSASVPEEKDKAKSVEMMNKMAKAVRKVTKNIGKEGYDAKKVQKELTAAMMGAMAS
jgi:hypothetical protein